MAKLINISGNWVIRMDLDQSDIEHQAENKKIRLTDEEVFKVMQSIVKCSDMAIGVNWETINQAIDNVVDARTELSHTGEVA